MRWLRAALKRMQEEQWIEICGIKKLFLPLHKHLQEEAETRTRTMMVQGKHVNKEHIVTLIIQSISTDHLLNGSSKGELVKIAQSVLDSSSQVRYHSENSNSNSNDNNNNNNNKDNYNRNKNDNNNAASLASNIPIGIDYVMESNEFQTQMEVEFYDKLRYQTFLYVPNEKLTTGNKVKITMIFPNKKKAVAAQQILNQSPEAKLYQWRAYRRQIPKKYAYCETSLRSMIAYWLTCLELKNVCRQLTI